MMTNSLSPDFIARSLRTCAVVLMLALPFAFFYYGLFPAVAILSGAVWGMVNLILLTALVKATIRPGGVEMTRAIVLGVIKFPLLYLAGYWLLKVPQFDPRVLLFGSLLPLVIMFLKAAGRVLLGLDQASVKNERVPRTS